MNARFTKRRLSTNGHARFSERIPASVPRNIFKSTAQSFLIVLVLLLASAVLVAALIYSLADPNRYIAPASMSLLYIFSLLGGFLSAKRHGGSALLCGLLFAAMMLATMMLTSLFFPLSLSADRSLAFEIGLRGIAIALSIAGAMIGTKPKKRKVMKRKRS